MFACCDMLFCSMSKAWDGMLQQRLRNTPARMKQSCMETRDMAQQRLLMCSKNDQPFLKDETEALSHVHMPLYASYQRCHESRRIVTRMNRKICTVRHGIDRTVKSSGRGMYKPDSYYSHHATEEEYFPVLTGTGSQSLSVDSTIISLM